MKYPFSFITPTEMNKKYIRAFVAIFIQMKKILLTLIVFGLYLSVSGQELITIGEIFDFENNNEFHPINQ